MNRKLLLAFLMMLTANCIFAQTDSVRAMILNYDESKPTIISKGRDLLLNKFIEGDLNQVEEITNFLLENEDENYYALSPYEHWLILYWTKDYEKLAKDIKQYDESVDELYQNRMRPSQDMLNKNLFERTFEKEDFIKQQLNEYEGISEETKEFLDLNLDMLLIELREDLFCQDTLNTRAKAFLTKYEDSEYSKYTKDYIIYEFVYKDWGMACEYYLGGGTYSKLLGNVFSPDITIGGAIDIFYKKLDFSLKINLGSSKTKQDLFYSGGTYGKGSSMTTYALDFSVGYELYNKGRFKVYPFLGIGVMNFSPSGIDKNKKLEELSFTAAPMYLAGVNFDIELGKKTPAFYPSTSYFALRIRYNCNIYGFGEEAVGNRHSISVGLVTMLRDITRKYPTP